MIVRDSYRDGVSYHYDPRNTYTLAKIQGLAPGQGLDFAR
jgi:hypothetical protein